jgi:hypothetical protein
VARVLGRRAGGQADASRQQLQASHGEGIHTSALLFPFYSSNEDGDSGSTFGWIRFGDADGSWTIHVSALLPLFGSTETVEMGTSVLIHNCTSTSIELIGSDSDYKLAKVRAIPPHQRAAWCFPFI